jgi:acetyl esterase/lipase
MASIQNFFIRLFLKQVVKKDKIATASVRSTRRGLEKLTELSLMPKGVVFEKAEHNGINLEWAIPSNLKNLGVVLYFHGGGYVSGSIKTHRALVGRIAKASKTKCLSVDYRLAPEHPFPAAVDDAVEVYHWLIKQGFAPSKIVLAGDSAGGGLTISTLLRLRDENAPKPAAGICLSPWLDLEVTGESATHLADKDLMVPAAGLKAFGLLYATTANICNPYASPIFADLAGLPPLYIQVSDYEVLFDDTTRFEKKAKAAGVIVKVEIWNKMSHVWQAYAPLLPEALRAIKKLGEYIASKTA